MGAWPFEIHNTVRHGDAWTAIMGKSNLTVDNNVTFTFCFDLIADFVFQQPNGPNVGVFIGLKQPAPPSAKFACINNNCPPATRYNQTTNSVQYGMHWDR